MSLFAGDGSTAAQETEPNPTAEPDSEKPTTETTQSDTSAPSTEEHQKQTPEILYKVSKRI